ncbi:MAG: PAS domain S-box protein, partial [Spirochaetales bacterium]|nr:PAS domain S-box protein [Spirochaetales bacterium]
MTLQEERAEYLNNTLRTIREINRLINYEKDTSSLLDGICRIITDSKGFNGGWIVLTKQEKPHEPYYHTGYGSRFQVMTDYLNRGKIPPCALAALDGKNTRPVVNHRDCGDCPFHSERSYCNNITCALNYQGKPLGWMSITVPKEWEKKEEQEEREEEIQFLADLAEDIAHALGMIRMEKELKESEERFQMLFQKAPLGYQSLDKDGNFIDVNEAWLTTLGYEKQEVLGRWFGDFLAPDYVEAFRERFPLFKERGQIHSEFYMIHKSGEKRYIIFEGRIGHKENGEFRQTHCILADHTQKKQVEDALKESEAHLRSIFENISVGVFVYEPSSNGKDFTLVDINRGGIKLTGKSREELKGQGVDRIFPGAWEMGLIDLMITASRTGSPQKLPMTAYRDKDRSLVLESHITPLPSGRLVVLHEDKTDFFQMEERLRQSEKMEAIGKLAGGVAHDFN